MRRPADDPLPEELNTLAAVYAYVLGLDAVEPWRWLEVLRAGAADETSRPDEGQWR
jgi:hypothetical protein